MCLPTVAEPPTTPALRCGACCCGWSRTCAPRASRASSGCAAAAAAALQVLQPFVAIPSQQSSAAKRCPSPPHPLLRTSRPVLCPPSATAGRPPALLPPAGHGRQGGRACGDGAGGPGCRAVRRHRPVRAERLHVLLLGARQAAAGCARCFSNAQTERREQAGGRHLHSVHLSSPPASRSAQPSPACRQSTGEAVTEQLREVAGDELDDLASAPRLILEGFLRKHWPPGNTGEMEVNVDAVIFQVGRSVGACRHHLNVCPRGRQNEQA